MKNCPLVSILIPAYKESFFREALQCAISQDYPALEIIICDDSATNVIRDEVDGVKLRCDIPLYYQKNTPSLGELENLQSCLIRAKGEYIKFLYDDDFLEAGCVSALVKAIQQPGVSLATSRRRRINSEGHSINDITATVAPVTEDTLFHGKDVVSFVCDSSINFIGEPSTILCRRIDLLELIQQTDGLFSLNGCDMWYFIDMSLYVKLLQRGNLAYLVHPWSSFRISSQQTTNSAQNAPEIVERTYKNFPLALKALGWYAPLRPGQSNFVRIKALNSSEGWREYDLNYGFNQGHKHAFMNNWLQQRQLSSIQTTLLNQRMEAYIDSRIICVCIRGNNAQLLEETLTSLSNFSHEKFRLIPLIIKEVENWHHHVTELNQAIEKTAADWFICVQAGDKFLLSGLIALATTLHDAGDCLALYGDEVIREEGFAHLASFRPDFNLDYFLSLPAMLSRYWLIKKEALIALNGYRAEMAPGHEFELAVRLVEGAGIEAIRHIHEPLINAIIAPQPYAQHQQILEEHLQRRGYTNGKVASQGEGIYRLWYGHQEQPLVSIIIPTKDQIALLVACVTSLMEKTHYQNYEILIVDNNSETPEAKTWLKGIEEMQSDRLRVLRYPYPFNYSAINNHAVQHAQGEYLVLLNNDTAIIDGHWLDALLNHGMRPEVGVTGAKLLYPDGKIQHAGVVLGLRGPAEHPFNGEAPDQPGYMKRLQVDQNYSVVTAACLLVRKSIYLEVGGLDEIAFKVSYNDVDFCLKVRERGYLTVWTPYSLVMHEGNVSQKSIDKTKQLEKLARFTAEQNAFLDKWLPITIQDPAYNSNLSLAGSGFEINHNSEFTWCPLTWRPLPVVLGCRSSHRQSAYQRILSPLKAMKAEGLAEGCSVEYALYMTEMAKYNPDSLIIQRQISPDFQQWIERIGKLTNTFKVFDLDENLPRLPLGSLERNEFSGDIGKMLRNTLSRVERVVVTTDALAETIRSLHHDILVVSPLLNPEWRELTSLKGQGNKTRICINSLGLRAVDVAIITEVIIELADKVEWVFIGSCSDRVKPWVYEHIEEIETTWFPVKLALLNLDLALAPLDGAAFNIGKGAHRLMEYGACAIPVICSDVESYRCGLSVTRVNNRPSEWRKAILQHIYDAQASYLQGEVLQQQVRDTCILEGDNIHKWSQAWLAN